MADYIEHEGKKGRNFGWILTYIFLFLILMIYVYQKNFVLQF